MRKLALVFVFLVSIVVGNTQPYPLLGSPNGNTIVAVNALRAFQLPRGVDTTLNGRNDSVGMLFYKTDKSVWLRVPSDGTANRWARFGGSLDSLYATQAWALSTFPQLSLQYNNPSWVATLLDSKLRSFSATNGQFLRYDGTTYVPTTLGSGAYTDSLRYLRLTGGTLTGALINSYTSTASTPASSLLGSWFNGGTSTTTKPHFLIEPTAATSTGWNANGTAFGVNAAPGFIGNLMDLHFNGTSQFRVALNAVVTSGQFTAGSTISATTSIISGGNYNLPNAYKVNWGGGNTFIEGADTYFRVQVNGVERWRILANGKTSQPTTANSPKGTATLVNGVVTINNTLATAGCFIQVNYLTGTALSTTSSILTVSSIVAATSFTVTAYNAGAATTNTSDNNTIEYTISN